MVPDRYSQRDDLVLHLCSIFHRCRQWRWLHRRRHRHPFRALHDPVVEQLRHHCNRQQRCRSCPSWYYYQYSHSNCWGECFWGRGEPPKGNWDFCRCRWYVSCCTHTRLDQLIFSQAIMLHHRTRQMVPRVHRLKRPLLSFSSPFSQVSLLCFSSINQPPLVFCQL